jgi:hypothetical protein
LALTYLLFLRLDIYPAFHSESIYSLFLHLRTPLHGLNSSFEHGLDIILPDFSTKAILGHDDIYIDALPASVPENSPLSGINNIHCSHITQPSGLKPLSSEKDYNILFNLRQYYGKVKTKRQLSLDVPAGVRNANNFQRQVHDYHLGNMALSDISPLSEESDSLSTSSPLQLSSVDTTHVPTLQESYVNETIAPTPSLATDSSSTVHVPILRCADKPSTSLPSRITYIEDFIRASVGFRRIDTMKKFLTSLYKDTISLDTLPPDAVLDAGDLATMRKSSWNTNPVPRPSLFGSIIHTDIVFGPDVALGNIHYALLFTDRFSRMTYLYPLQNLTADIRKQLQAFFAHLGFTPDRLITDFDTKLIGGKAWEYLNSLMIHVNAAPANLQDRNGLAERHWQTMTSMARNWLASAELPAKFWFFAVKRAAEICNYFPIRLEDGSWSTPLELAHKVKPDLRVLFKMFGLAAVRREQSGNQHPNKF